MAKSLVFIDDSGDPGFRGATSANFVMAAALFIDSEVATMVNKTISDFRISLGWQEETEFKFRKTNKRIIKQLLSMVTRYDFGVYSVYMDKSSFGHLLPILNKEKLYVWAIKELLKIIPLENAYIKIDGRSSKNYRKRVSSYLRHEINTENYKIGRIKQEDSVKDNLIQLADLIAGSINRSLQTEKSDAGDYLALLKKNIARIERLKFGDE